MRRRSAHSRVLRAPARSVGAALAVLLLASCGSESPRASTGAQDRAGAHAPAVDSTALSKLRSEYAAEPDSARPIFEKYLPVLGAAPILDVLERSSAGCHAQSHALGQALYASARDIGSALRQCDTRCTSGCMHGAVAAAFGDVTVQVIADTMEAFCGAGEMANLHRPGNCAHGLGHALMFVTQGNVERSIDGCLGFAQGPMQYYCGTGVYMERFMRDSADAVDASSLGPCDEEALFPAACYRYQGVEMVKALGRVAAKSECARLGGLQRHGCFHGLGYAAIETVFYDPEQLRALCDAGDTDDRVVCVEGTIEKLAEFHEGRARAACAFTDDDLRAVCNQAVERKMYGAGRPTFALYYEPQAIARRQASIAAAGGSAGRPSPRHHH